MARVVVFLMAVSLIFDLTMMAVDAEGNRHIFDNAGYLSEESVAELEDKATAYKEATGIDLLVVTDTSLDGQVPKDYVTNLVTENGFADFIVLMTIEDAESDYIYNGGEAAQYIDDAEFNRIFDAYDVEETYTDGFRAYLETSFAIVRTAQTGTAVEPAPVATQPAGIGDIDFADDSDANQQMIPEERQKPRLVDEANLLSESEYNNLLKRLDDLSEKYWCDIAIVTVNDIGFKTPMDFADDYYDYNGYGYGPDDDGMLFLLSMADRDWWMTTHAYGRYVFSNEGLDYIFDRIKDPLGNNDFNAAFNQFVDECEVFLNKARNENEAYNVQAVADAKGRMYTMPVTGALGAVLGGKGVTDGMRRKLKSVKLQPSAVNYIAGGAQLVTNGREHLVDRRVNYIAIPKKSSSSGGGGSHTSSSGRSHGGSGGKF